MAVILGLSPHFINNAVALLIDGHIDYACEEERLNREKKTRKFPVLGIHELLSKTKLSLEDVDVVGLSCLSGSQNNLFPRVVELLRKKGMNEVLVIGGGIIPEEDITFLRERGISRCFGPGTSIKDVSEFIKQHVH